MISASIATKTSNNLLSENELKTALFVGKVFKGQDCSDTRCTVLETLSGNFIIIALNPSEKLYYVLDNSTYPDYKQYYMVDELITLVIG